MNFMEKSMLLDELFALRKADKEERDRLLEKLDRMTEQLMNLNESSQMQMKQNDELKQMVASRDILIEKLQEESAALKEQKKQDRKNLYGSKIQKISRKKDDAGQLARQRSRFYKRSERETERPGHGQGLHCQL